MQARWIVWIIALVGSGLLPCVARADLSPTAAERVGLSRLAKVKKCYKRTLAVRPKKFGVVTLKFRVSPTGRVLSGTVALSSLADPELEQCILGAFNGVVFPSPGESDVEVSFALLLTSEDTPADLVERARDAFRGTPPPSP